MEVVTQGDLFVQGRGELGVGAQALGPHLVQAGVDHDAVEPPLDRAGVAEGIRLPVRRDESLLQGLGGVVAVERRADGQPPEVVVVPPDEGGEGVGVPGDVRVQQFGVGQR